MKLKHYASHLWCGLFLTSVVGFTLERQHFVQAFTSQEHYRYLVIDDTCFFLPKSFDFANAHDLHFEQAQLACESLLNRGPAGVDNKTLLEHLYRPEALEKAKQIIENEAVDFQNRSIYQKVNIAKIWQMQMKGDSVLIQVTGQLIRSGEFMDKPFVEGLEFEGQFHFVLNRRVIENGRFPTIVYDFNLKTKAIPSA